MSRWLSFFFVCCVMLHWCKSKLFFISFNLTWFFSVSRTRSRFHTVYGKMVRGSNDYWLFLLVTQNHVDYRHSFRQWQLKWTEIHPNPILPFSHRPNGCNTVYFAPIFLFIYRVVDLIHYIYTASCGWFTHLSVACFAHYLSHIFEIHLKLKSIRNHFILFFFFAVNFGK